MRTLKNHTKNHAENKKTKVNAADKKQQNKQKFLDAADKFMSKYATALKNLSKR